MVHVFLRYFLYFSRVTFWKLRMWFALMLVMYGLLYYFLCPAMKWSEYIVISRSVFPSFRHHSVLPIIISRTVVHIQLKFDIWKMGKYSFVLSRFMPRIGSLWEQLTNYSHALSRPSWEQFPTSETRETLPCCKLRHTAQLMLSNFNCSSM